LQDSRSDDYCVDLIARGDEDFHLTLPYALAEDRPRLAALFAFQVELRRIPVVVSEPPLGEIRLQWWREALDEIAVGDCPRAHPVVEALADADAVGAFSRPLLERLIDARARVLYAPRYDGLSDLSAFLAAAEAPMASLALGRDGLEDAAVAYVLARFAPLVAPHFAGEAAREALRQRVAVRAEMKSLSGGDAGRVAFLFLTRGYATHGARPWALMKRLTMFRGMMIGAS
jgi:phytoene synthase